MTGSSVHFIVARMAEMIQEGQNRLTEIDEQIDKMTDEAKDVHKRIENIEQCRRTLLDLQSEI